MYNYYSSAVCLSSALFRIALDTAAGAGLVEFSSVLSVRVPLHLRTHDVQSSFFDHAPF